LAIKLITKSIKILGEDKKSKNQNGSKEIFIKTTNTFYQNFFDVSSLR